MRIAKNKHTFENFYKTAKMLKRKIFEEIERRAIDLSIEKVRVKLSESLSDKDYDKQLDTSMKSVEKGLKQVYS